MVRRIRRLVAVAAVACVGATGLVVGASAPAGADDFGYTIEVLLPQGNGIGPQCRLATVDLATGEVTGIGAFQSYDTYACANDLAFSPDGVLYGISDVDHDENGQDPGGDSVDGADGEGAGEEGAGDVSTATSVAPANGILPEVHLVRFDTATGAVTDLGAIGVDGATLIYEEPGGITFDAAGNLWVYMVGFDAACDESAFCLYRVNPADPADATFVGNDPAETFLYGLTASCALGVFTVESTDGPRGAESLADVLVGYGGNRLDRVDTAAGVASAAGGFFGGAVRIQALDFGADGVLYALGMVLPNGILQPGSVYVLDPATGSATERVALSAAETTYVQGLAVAPPTCAQPAAEVVPTFTG